MSETSSYDRTDLLADLASVEEQLAAIRLRLEGTAPAPFRPAADTQEGEDPTLRQLFFLHVFYVAPAHALTAAQASEAARTAGYDPRGTAGFYVGAHGSLKSVGNARVLTDTGRKWYEANAPYYAHEIAARFPDE